MKRELIVTANGRDRTVSIDGPLEDGKFRVAIDGAERVADARALRPGTWSLIVDGTSSLGISCWVMRIVPVDLYVAGQEKVTITVSSASAPNAIQN